MIEHLSFAFCSTMYIGPWVFQELLEAHDTQRMTRSKSSRFHIKNVHFKCLPVQFHTQTSNKTDFSFHVSNIFSINIDHMFNLSEEIMRKHAETQVIFN